MIKQLACFDCLEEHAYASTLGQARSSRACVLAEQGTPAHAGVPRKCDNMTV